MSVEPDERKTTDAIIGNPFIHFIISETWAGLTSVVVYLLFRTASFATQYITEHLPLQDQAPSDFLELIISWGASLSAAATFTAVTAYQLLVLLKRLRADLQT
jgi:hypothetical protein